MVSSDFVAYKKPHILHWLLHGQFKGVQVKGRTGQAASEVTKCAVEPAGRLTHVLAEQFISKYYVRIMNAHSEGVRSACDGVKSLGTLKVALQWFTEDRLHFMNNLLHLVLNFLTFICKTRRNKSILKYSWLLNKRYENDRLECSYTKLQNHVSSFD